MTRRTEWPLFQKFSSYCSTVSQTSRSRYVGMTNNKSLAGMPRFLLPKQQHPPHRLQPPCPPVCRLRKPKMVIRLREVSADRGPPPPCIPPAPGCKMHDGSRRASGRAKCKVGIGPAPDPRQPLHRNRKRERGLGTITGGGTLFAFPLGRLAAVGQDSNPV